MKRLALLFGTNAASSPPLNGVDRDIQRLYQHLTSDLGGAWEQDEIRWYKSPLASQIRSLLREAVQDGVEYLFTAFSGHGFADLGTLTSHVVLNDVADRTEATFPVEALAKHIIPRQVILVDACRVISRLALKVGVAKTAIVAGLSGVEAQTYRRSCRALFDAKVASIAPGTVLLQSCSIAETSWDHPTGGLFTHTMLDAAARWGSTSANWQRAMSTLSICEAFGIAEAETRVQADRSGRPQTPVSAVHHGAFLLPFAVA